MNAGIVDDSVLERFDKLVLDPPGWVSLNMSIGEVRGWYLARPDLGRSFMQPILYDLCRGESNFSVS